MTKAGQARAITAMVLTGLGLYVAVARVAPRSATAPATPAPPPAPREPNAQDALYAMFDAARAGDAAAYLDRFTGALAASLRRTATEQGEAKFAQYLRATYEPVKGIVVEEPEAAGNGEVKARVELVFGERNERQTYFLARQSGGAWKVVRLELASQMRPTVPYGSPAN